MKRKVTKKWIRENFKNIITAGYCDMQSLLSRREPDYYTTGVYGWNEDIYIIDNNTAICTGYRPISGKRIPFDEVWEAEKQAHKIATDWAMDYTEQKEALEKMVLELIAKAE